MRKVFCIMFVVILLLTLCVPAFAYSGMGTDTIDGNYYSHMLGWDSMWFDMYSTRQVFSQPYFQFKKDLSADTTLPQFTFNLWDPQQGTDEVNFSMQGQAAFVSSSDPSVAVVRTAFSVNPYSSSTKFRFGFEGKTPVYCDFDSVYNTCLASSIISIPAYCKLTYSLAFDLLVPLRSVANDGSVNWDWVEASLMYNGIIVSNTSGSDGYYSYLPSFSTLLSGSGLDSSIVSQIQISNCIILSSSWSGVLSSTSVMPAPAFEMTHLVTSRESVIDSSVYLPTVLEAYKDYQVVAGSDVADSDFTSWLGVVLEGIWNSQLLPGVTLGHLVFIVFAIGMLFMFLKLFGR